MNSINILGNICNDMELKATQSGKSVCSFNIAVKRPFASDITDFFKVVCWGKTAENVCKYCGKGSKVGVTGMLTTRKYTDKDGIDRTTQEIVANNVFFFGGKSEATQAESTQAETQTDEYGFYVTDNEDDLPF